MNKTAYIILVVVVLGIVGFAVYQTTKSQTGSSDSSDQSAPASPQSSDTIVPGAIATLFYGNGCPHCANVDKWLTENKVADKVKFDKREVWYNKDNSGLLSEKAKSCGITENSVGVPFLYDNENNKCYSGEVEVENFFKNKL